MNASLRLTTLIAATALLAACGGGGGGSPSTPTPPSGGSPTQPTQPTNDAAQYKGFLEATINLVLTVDHASKTAATTLIKIKADVVAHGPFVQCEDSSCPTEEDTSQYYNLQLPEGGSVLVKNWRDMGNDAAWGTGDQVYVALQGVGAPKVDATNLQIGEVSAEEVSIGLSALKLTDSSHYKLDGTLWSKRTGAHLDIRDRRESDVNGATRNLIIDEFDSAGTKISSWAADYVAQTNPDDVNAVSYDIDMLNYIGGGKLKLKTSTALGFANQNGKTVMTGGSYTYSYDDNAGKKTALRVSVDADPAYLQVEIDEGADGTYDKSGRLLQTDLDYDFQI